MGKSLNQSPPQERHPAKSSAQIGLIDKPVPSIKQAPLGNIDVISSVVLEVVLDDVEESVVVCSSKGTDARLIFNWQGECSDMLHAVDWIQSRALGKAVRA